MYFVLIPRSIVLWETHRDSYVINSPLGLLHPLIWYTYRDSFHKVRLFSPSRFWDSVDVSRTLVLSYGDVGHVSFHLHFHSNSSVVPTLRLPEITDTSPVT